MCWSAGTKELASLFLSYLRYLSYLELSKRAFNPFFVPCSLLSEKEGGSGVPFSSLGTTTEVRPTCAVPGQALHTGEKFNAPLEKAHEESVVWARAC